MESDKAAEDAAGVIAAAKGPLSITFERKPDRAGEVNEISCVSIACEAPEPTVLLLRCPTPKGRCETSGFLTKKVAPYEGTKYVTGSEKSADAKKFNASFGIELSSLGSIKALDAIAEVKRVKARGPVKLAELCEIYVDRAGVSTIAKWDIDELTAEQKKFASESAWFTRAVGEKLVAMEVVEKKEKEEAPAEPAAEEKPKKKKGKGGKKEEAKE